MERPAFVLLCAVAALVAGLVSVVVVALLAQSVLG
jgi:hypothetical protein